MKNIHKGFTLIELMIVVAIVGILAGIGYPSYSAYIQNTHRHDAKAGLSKLMLLQEQFYLDNDQYATSLASGATNTLADSGWANSSPYYKFTLDPSSGTSSYTAIATVNSDSSQTSDTDCHRFTIDDKGSKKSANATKSETTDCW